MKTRAVAALVTVSLFAGTLAANFLVVGDLLQSLYGISTAMGISSFAGIVIAVSLVVILTAFVFLSGLRVLWRPVLVCLSVAEPSGISIWQRSQVGS